MTKEELKAYQYIKREREHLAEKLEELETAMCLPRSQRLDGMPRSGSSESYIKEEQIDSKEELLALYQEKTTALLGALVHIERAIETLDPRERHLVRLHYIDGKTWEQVAVEMGYSWRQVHRIHGEALEKLKDVGTTTSRLELMREIAEEVAGSE